MDPRRRLMRVIGLGTLGGAMGCADLLGADFDVHPIAPHGSDAAYRSDSDGADGSETGNGDATDARTISDGAESDVGNDGSGRDGAIVDGGARDGEYDRHDVDVRDGGSPTDGKDLPGDARDDVDSGDPGGGPDGGGAIDGRTEPPPDGPRSTGIVGGFVSLGAPGGRASTIELCGHFIPDTVTRGVTSSGFTIEGKIQ